MADSEPVCVLRNHHGFCSCQGSGKQRVQCTGFKQDCNLKNNTGIIKQLKRHMTSVSSVSATKIASGFKQTATAILVGKRGKGKSLTAGSIMESYAAKIAVMLKDDAWEADKSKYFTIENVGIIDLDDIMRAIKRMREPEYRYNGFILDDVGKTLDAREFMSKKNKVLNKIFQTCRTKNCFTIMTIPDDSGLDKDPRENSDFFGIMEQAIFERDLAVGRFFEQNKQYRSGAMWYVYLRSAGSPIVRHAFLSPSKEYIDQYEPRREAMADKLFDKSMVELDDLIHKEDGEKPEKKEKVTNAQLAFEAYRDTEAGLFPDLKLACADKGVSYKYATWAKCEGRLAKYGLAP